LRCVQVSLLPQRWRLSQHPLFQLACQRLKLIPPNKENSNKQSAGENNVDTVEKIVIEAYNQVAYPTKSDIRYTSLMQDCKKVIAVAQDNPHLFRRFKIIVSKFSANANKRDQRPGHAPRNDPSNHEKAVIWAPVSKLQRRGRPANNEDPNMSGLCRPKKRHLGNNCCSLCRSNGIDASDHRKGSRCPFHKQSQ
jgi:hypothetical protein